MAKLPVKTIVLRQSIREGLVAARLFGAKHANGEVIRLLESFTVPVNRQFSIIFPRATGVNVSRCSLRMFNWLAGTASG